MDAVLIAEWIVVFCLGTIVFTYLGYPLFIALASRLFGQSITPGQSKSDADVPFVSILISAHNEENDIGMRLENLLALDYPSEQALKLSAVLPSVPTFASVPMRSW